MPYTPLPPPPQRNKPENFADDGDAFLGALPQFGLDMEAVRLTAIDAIAAAPIAIAAANYKGEYSAVVTYQVGQSVSYAGARWYAKDVNLWRTPADNAYWGVIRDIPDPAGHEGHALRAIGGVPSWVADAVTRQEFVASGTWSMPSRAAFVFIEAFGGGGGGANRIGSNSAGGGNGGQYTSALFLASQLAASYPVVVGLGGSGGANGVDASGSAGGNSSFGSILVARGGRGGMHAASGAFYYPGFQGDLISATVTPTPEFNALHVTAHRLDYGFGGAAGNSTYAPGGNCAAGGGGGGAAWNTTVGTSTGGLSWNGGQGGGGNCFANTRATDGGFPSGGGGASTTNGGGGNGGNGCVRVWAW